MAKWKDTGLDYFEQERQYTSSAMVREFSKVLEQKPDVALYQRLICEEYEEWCKEAPHTVKDLKELADLVYVIHGYAHAAGYNLDEAVERVHDNNLGRCVQPDGTVRRREDGKIIKNPDYPAVYLEDLI
jgi:predicted HAD superfamily Cof-like phosphohydrolase